MGIRAYLKGLCGTVGADSAPVGCPVSLGGSVETLDLTWDSYRRGVTKGEPYISLALHHATIPLWAL